MSNLELELQLSQAPLGKKTGYVDQYDSSLLFPIPRVGKREEIGIRELPFIGFDFWTAYELSWLNVRGCPVVAVGEFRIPADSPCLIESKSLKLYLNSFNQSRFESMDQVAQTIEKDLTSASGAAVHVKLSPLREVDLRMAQFDGIYLDELQVSCERYEPHPEYLSLDTQEEVVHEVLVSDLLKSNCLVTGQPDWGSVRIEYRGQKINHEGVLKYLVSFRNHNEFHEQCVERIFMDLLRNCQPQMLSVYARYTRRGGLDINPLRSTEHSISFVDQVRLVRQ